MTFLASIHLHYLLMSPQCVIFEELAVASEQIYGLYVFEFNPYFSSLLKKKKYFYFGKKLKGSDSLFMVGYQSQLADQ